MVVMIGLLSIDIWCGSESLLLLYGMDWNEVRRGVKVVFTSDHHTCNIRLVRCWEGRVRMMKVEYQQKMKVIKEDDEVGNEVIQQGGESTGKQIE